MIVSPLVYENTSFNFPISNTAFDEHQSYDTTIPFLDENQRSSTSMKSCESPSKQRTRNWSRLSERHTGDNQSTVTVNVFLSIHSFVSSTHLFSSINLKHMSNMHLCVKFYLVRILLLPVFHRKVSQIYPLPRWLKYFN